MHWQEEETLSVRFNEPVLWQLIISAVLVQAAWAPLLALPLPSESLEHGSYMYISANDRVYVLAVFARQHFTQVIQRWEE